MVAWIIVGLLVSSRCFHGVSGIPSGESSDPEPSTRRRLTIDDVTSVLITEVHSEYSSHRVLEKTSNVLWNAAMDHEWARAREVERAAQKSGSALRRTSEASGKFPYLVCDVEPGKSGESCRTTVEEHFGTDLRPVSNQLDKTCYIVSTVASKANTSPNSIIVSPMLPEMKLEKGIVDAILFADNPMPRKFESILCPGQVSSNEDGELLVQDILTRLKKQEGTNGRRLEKKNLFERDDDEKAIDSGVTRETRDYERSPFWNRTLQDDVGFDLCKGVFGGLQSSVLAKGNSFYFESPVQYTNDTARKCLILLVTGLASQPEVCWIGIVPDMVPLNSEAQWISQSRQQNWRPFFDVGLTGRGQVIAVSDSGLDTDNCYFWDASGEVPKDGTVDMTRRKVVQYVSLGDDSDDMKGHGTHVAGTAAGMRAIDGITESPGEVDGIAPGAKIAFVDLGESGEKTLKIPHPPSSIYEHVVNGGSGSNVHSSSWGIGYNYYGGVETDLDSFMVENPDLLIVLAAGNSGAAPNTVGSPATCKNALSVGASQNAISHTKTGMLGEDYLAWFSSAGPTHDGRMKPEVIAPGYFIRSAESRPDKVGECDEADANATDGIMYSAGTSMAAPVVAGSAALIREYFEEGWYPSGRSNPSDSMNPSSCLVKAILINGAQPLLARQHEDLTTISESQEYDIHQGFGAITLITSLPLAGKNQLRARLEDRKAISNGQEHTYEVTIEETNGCKAPLSATLVWTDPAGAPGCAICLLNNLDLDITQADESTMHHPNGKSEPDTVNNAERVRVHDVSDGDTFVVRVKGTNLESTSQDYSLIITGCLGETVSIDKVTRQSQSQECLDQDGTVLMDDKIGMKSCSWLEAHKDTFDYLCMFKDVAITCPDTCGFCPSGGTSSSSEVRSLKTVMDGTVEWYGTMFNVVAQSNVTVKSLSFHTPSTGPVNVAVYTKQGMNAVGSDQIPEDWTLIAETTVQGRGFGNITSIPTSDFKDVSIKQGNVQSFYVTTGDDKNVILSGGSQVTLELHNMWAENTDFTLLTGEAVTGKFGGAYSPYAWNGHINYLVELGCIDGNGTVNVENVGEKTCDWLSTNQIRFGYLCDRIQVAATCPVTCNFCSYIEV